MVMFIAVVVGLVARVAEPAPWAAAALLLVGCLGYGFNVIAISHGLDLDLEGGPAVILKITGLFFPLTFIGLGLMLLKTRSSHVAAAATIVAGAALFPVSRIGEIEPLMIAVDLLFLAGLVGVALTSQGDRQSVGSSSTSARRSRTHW
ncbi:MAG: hypothetical protein ACR2FE_06205 [Aeromicrobium sp.]